MATECFRGIQWGSQSYINKLREVVAYHSYAQKTGKKIKKNSQEEISQEQKTAGQVYFWDFAENWLEAEKEEVILYFDLPDSWTESQESTTLS